MKFDSNNLLVSEIGTFPGTIGDACANTSRYVTLSLSNKPNLALFVTISGVLRYPTSPWGVNDTSSDQIAPLLNACSLTQPLLANIIISQIKEQGYKTGNGNYVTLGLLASIRRHEKKSFLWLSDLAILAQAISFYLPITFENGKFTKNTNTSNYLNFADYIKYASQYGKMTFPLKLAKKIMPRSKVLDNIKKYFTPEPNVAWLLALYDQEYK